MGILYDWIDNSKETIEVVAPNPNQFLIKKAVNAKAELEACVVAMASIPFVLKEYILSTQVNGDELEQFLVRNKGQLVYMPDMQVVAHQDESQRSSYLRLDFEKGLAEILYPLLDDSMI